MNDILTNQYTTLLDHLHRGGQFAHWWTPDSGKFYTDKKTGEQKQAKFSSWFPAGRRSAIPAAWRDKNVYFCVHPQSAIPQKSRDDGNVTDQKYVKAWVSHVAAVNCFFAEYDVKHYGSKEKISAHLRALPLYPSVVIDSGGGFHCYWLLANTVTVTDDNRDHIKRLQYAWVKMVGSDDDAKDLARVLRVPGTLNRKEKYAPNYPTVTIMEADYGRLYSLEEFERLTEHLRQEKPKSTYAGSHSVTDDLVTAAENLKRLSPSRRDRYQEWMNVGFALKGLGNAGLQLWDEWSRGSTNYTEGCCDAKWDKMSDTGLGLGSLVKWANDDDPAGKRTYTNGTNSHAPYTNGHSKPVTPGEPTPEPAPVGEISEAEKEHLTDLGNGKRIARLHGQDLRYTQAFGWATWDGARWKRDETGQVMRIAKQTALGFYAESARIMEKAKAAVKAAEAAATNNDADSANKHSEKARELMKLAYALSDWAKKCQGRARLEAMIALAQSELPIATHSDDFDKNDWLLNVNNGAIDLRTGRLQPHRREDYITKIAPVHFDPHATCPTWMAFLRRIMNGDQDVIDFLQRAIGYSLTGATVDHALFFAYGGGQNGKSTFFETLAALLGEYWQKAPTEILMVKDRTTGIPNDIARLVGLRMVVAAEVEEGSRMAEKQVKDLTGGDTLVARFLNKEFFEFKPTHKVWMYGNHKPVIRGTDTGIWRRVKLIPFMVTIPENERDPDLKNKLFQELPGILAWAVQGCLDWQKNGLKPPTVVQLATEQYKTESDTFSAFLSECTIKKEDARTQAGKLYLAYQTWCKENGEKPLGGNRFGGQLVEHGFKKHQAMGRFYYNGIGLLLDE